MIKNLLYSIFLHFILILVVYLNFNVKKFEEIKSNEVAVSLISIDGYEEATLLKPVENNTSEIIKEEIKETGTKEVKKVEEKPKSDKKSEKNKIKKKSRKPTKSKTAKSIKQKPVKTVKKSQQEKENEKQQESDKNKKNIEKNEKNSEKEQEKGSHKDLGAKEQSKEKVQEEESSSKQEEEAIDMANSIENIDLSAREKFNIKSQIKLCYKRAIDETGLKSGEKILINIKINEEGYIKSNLENITDNEKYNNPEESHYKIAIDNVKRALELCSPLRNLPADKYEIWREVVLEFSSDDAIEKEKE